MVKQLEKEEAKMFRKKKGQSTLEYVVILMGILAAIIFAVTKFAPNEEGSTGGLRTVFQNSAVRMESATGRLASIVN